MRFRCAHTSMRMASPDDKLPSPAFPSAYHLLGPKSQRDLRGRVFDTVGAVHRIALDALGVLFADGAGSGLGRVRGAHDVAIDLDRVLTLQHLYHDGTGGHELDEVAIEGS